MPWLLLTGTLVSDPWATGCPALRRDPWVWQEHALPHPRCLQTYEPILGNSPPPPHQISRLPPDMTALTSQRATSPTTTTLSWPRPHRPFTWMVTSTQLTAPPGSSLSLFYVVASVRHVTTRPSQHNTLLEGSHHPRYRPEVLPLSLACRDPSQTTLLTSMPQSCAPPTTTMQSNRPPKPELL